MKILIIDKAGDGILDTAIRAQCAGHEVKMFLRDYDKEKRPVGKGLVDLIPDWRTHIRWCDICLLSGNDYCMAELDRWRDEGVLIIGGGVESARWEHDRAYGMTVFKKAGIEVPEYREFTSYEEAARYVKRRGEPFASKPSGNCDDKSLSYVAKTAADLVYMLERWQKVGKRQGVEFILQDKIEGVEFAVGGWFGPGGFAPGWEENFEFKKLAAGDVGPNTGELGTVMRLVRRSRLADLVLVPLEEQLAAIGYVGNIDVNCIVDEDGNPWPLEFTTRFGWPAWNIESTLFNCDPIEFLGALAAGSTFPTNSRRLNEVALGAYIRFLDHRGIVGAPIYGPLIDDDHGLAPKYRAVELMVTRAPHQSNGSITETTCLGSAGDHPLVCTGTGSSVKEAARKCYQALNKIHIPGSPFHRNDIGARLKKQLPKLQEHGYATGMEFA